MTSAPNTTSSRIHAAPDGPGVQGVCAECRTTYGYSVLHDHVGGHCCYVRRGCLCVPWPMTIAATTTPEAAASALRLLGGRW
jgi:hypothetical protein